jgi:hypothetical protein
MVPRHNNVLAGARRAADLVFDLVNVVREVNEWRHERDAFVASYMEQARRRGDAPAQPRS